MRKIDVIDPDILHGLPKNINLSLAEMSRITEYLQKSLGSRHRDLISLILLLSAFAIILIGGILGNLSTCFVIWKNSYMHISTNFYIFSLAISDFIQLLIGLPLEMYMIYESYPWIFGKIFCKLRAAIYESTIFASVLIIICLSTERYIAICHPMRFHKKTSLKRCTVIIIIIWIFSFLLSAPYYETVDAYEYYQLNTSKGPIPLRFSRICAFKRQYWTMALIYMLMISIIMYIFAFAIVASLYTLIAIKLYKAVPKSNPKDTKIYSQHFIVTAEAVKGSRRSAVRMLIVVVCAFFVCWCPFHAQRIIGALVHFEMISIHKNLGLVQEILFYLSAMLSYLSAAINPILYNIMSKRYRTAFEQTIFRSRMTCKKHSRLPD